MKILQALNLLNGNIEIMNKNNEKKLLTMDENKLKNKYFFIDKKNMNLNNVYGYCFFLIPIFLNKIIKYIFFLLFEKFLVF